MVHTVEDPDDQSPGEIGDLLADRLFDQVLEELDDNQSLTLGQDRQASRVPVGVEHGLESCGARISGATCPIG